ncbi:hypothetical protein OSSY52_13970 [Tepiditoga spiralis]|uniref:Deoxynucleoside kinase domain-containing protein n=1 Tax=Tepiditoga spiralis TaxID=2108365 RepID=A0A7G1G7D7_9BACT|nr:deoxynucleoside kinase [Tepiditoga spiralis]BBE31256.1 hypothetical protein OSSY52_13970 [Tepiditoga spiralis]
MIDNNILNFFKQKKIRIHIEGNIGCGKTTLANALFEKLNADELILEEFENNPYLPLLYQKKDVGFQTEMFFLVSRFKQYKNELQNKFIISDYDMLKNKIFAEITIKDENEKDKFLKIYDILNEEIRSPDVLIYIDINTEVAIQRIKKRSRSIEKIIEKDYLEVVNNSYKKYFKKQKNYIKIDGNTFNVFEEKELNELILKIKKFVEKN